MSRTVELLCEWGAEAELTWLPDRGIDGNAHFCRGLLRTRYPGSESDQAPRADGADLPFPTVRSEESVR